MRVGADSWTQTETCRGEMDCKTTGINAPAPQREKEKDWEMETMQNNCPYNHLYANPESRDRYFNLLLTRVVTVWHFYSI